MWELYIIFLNKVGSIDPIIIRSEEGIWEKMNYLSIKKACEKHMLFFISYFKKRIFHMLN
jgi:hypothetical protein